MRTFHETSNTLIIFPPFHIEYLAHSHHACATRLLATGLSLKEIGDHLGHRSTSATSTYAKVNIGALREVAAFDLGDLQ